MDIQNGYVRSTLTDLYQLTAAYAYFKAGKHSFTLKRTTKRAGGRFTKVHFRE